MITLTGSQLESYKGKPPTGRGWLTVTEVSVDGQIISANFCPEGQTGFGAVAWPLGNVHAFVRGNHGELSPFAALKEVFNSKCAATALA